MITALSSRISPRPLPVTPALLYAELDVSFGGGSRQWHSPSNSGRSVHALTPVYRLSQDAGEEEDWGWAIGSELEFVDEPADDWDGPVGDGLDEEEGIGGMAIQNPRPPTPETPSGDSNPS